LGGGATGLTFWQFCQNVQKHDEILKKKYFGPRNSKIFFKIFYNEPFKIMFASIFHVENLKKSAISNFYPKKKVEPPPEKIQVGAYVQHSLLLRSTKLFGGKTCLQTYQRPTYSNYARVWRKYHSSRKGDRHVVLSKFRYCELGYHRN